MTKHLLLFAGLVLSPLVVAKVDASDYQVAVQRKKTAAQAMKARRSGADSKGSETVYYQVTVTNRAFNQTSNELEAHYVLFVERQQLGAKIGTEQTERIRGQAKVEPMKPQQKATFDTTEVLLEKAGLSGRYVGYEGGGRTRAEDSLQGVWIKLYDGGVEVGEYINPTTLRNKMSWE